MRRAGCLGRAWVAARSLLCPVTAARAPGKVCGVVRLSSRKTVLWVSAGGQRAGEGSPSPRLIRTPCPQVQPSPAAQLVPVQLRGPRAWAGSLPRAGAWRPPLGAPMSPPELCEDPHGFHH